MEDKFTHCSREIHGKATRGAQVSLSRFRSVHPARSFSLLFGFAVTLLAAPLIGGFSDRGGGGGRAECSCYCGLRNIFLEAGFGPASWCVAWGVKFSKKRRYII